MALPGENYHAADSADLALFIDTCCQPCNHLGYCTILAHAASYGGASEWREVEEGLVCIRQETAGDHEDTPLQRNDSTGAAVLSLVQITVDEAIVSTWPDEQFWQAMDWASLVILEASDCDVEASEMPAFLQQYQGVK